MCGFSSHALPPSVIDVSDADTAETRPTADETASMGDGVAAPVMTNDSEHHMATTADRTATAVRMRDAVSRGRMAAARRAGNGVMDWARYLRPVRITTWSRRRVADRVNAFILHLFCSIGRQKNGYQSVATKQMQSLASA